jgi:hypothetical protein
MSDVEDVEETPSEPSTNGDLHDEGGDPACWAHLFDGDAEGPTR